MGGRRDDPQGPGEAGGHRSIVENRIRPTFGRTPLRRLDARLLDEFYRHLETDKGLSPAGITSIHALVRSTLRMAVRWGWLTSNPARDANPPQVVAAGLRAATAWWTTGECRGRQRLHAFVAR